MDRSFFYAHTFMNSKGLYAEKPASFQLFTLLLFILLGSVLAGMIGAFIFPWPMDTANKLRLIQFLSSVSMFLCPAIVAAYLFSKDISSYLSMQQGVPGIKIITLTFISIVVISPVISATNILNQQIVFPAFMEPIESWMKAQEAEMTRITKLLMDSTDGLTLFFNLIVIAVAAGVTEEFLFRGTLQRILGRWFSNHHTVIWVAAFVFSAVHIQFYGLLPRMLLGAYFGYLLYWSRNIYIPIFAHFVNNMLGVITMSNPKLANNKILSDQALLVDILPFAAAGLVLSGVIILMIKKSLLERSGNL